MHGLHVDACQCETAQVLLRRRPIHAALRPLRFVSLSTDVVPRLHVQVACVETGPDATRDVARFQVHVPGVQGQVLYP